jgi:hypothetical protein
LPYHSKYDTGLLFDKEWWNAPYKRGSEKEWFIQDRKYMTH